MEIMSLLAIIIEDINNSAYQHEASTNGNNIEIYLRDGLPAADCAHSLIDARYLDQPWNDYAIVLHQSSDGKWKVQHVLFTDDTEKRIDRDIESAIEEHVSRIGLAEMYYTMCDYIASEIV